MKRLGLILIKASLSMVGGSKSTHALILEGQRRFFYQKTLKTAISTLFILENKKHIFFRI